MNNKKLLNKILNNQNNIRFSELVKLVEAFGFTLVRVNGSHHIYSSPLTRELVNLQNVKGEAKPYQIRQFLILVEKYNLSLEK